MPPAVDRQSGRCSQPVARSIALVRAETLLWCGGAFLPFAVQCCRTEADQSRRVRVASCGGASRRIVSCRRLQLDQVRGGAM